MGKIKVIIADDNWEFCQILSKFISSQEEFHVLGIAKDGLEALELIERKTRYINFRHNYASLRRVRGFRENERN